MFRQETTGTTHVCPSCGDTLTKERALLRCVEHGHFFAYGPQLLVRVPSPSSRLPDPILPWENHEVRRVSQQ